MAELDFYSVEIKNLQKKLFDKLKKAIPRLNELSDTQVISIAQEIDFFQELDELGYGTLLNKMNDAYEAEIIRAYKEVSRLRVGVSATGAVIMDNLKGFELNYLSDSVREYADEIKVAMLRGIVTGESTDAIITNMFNEFGPGKRIGSARSVALVNDAFARFSNATRLKAYEQFPETKFDYVGPTTGNIRDACSEVKRYVAKNGPLTLAEIRNLRDIIGVQKDGSEFFGFSDRGGFNCRHDWVSVIE